MLDLIGFWTGVSILTFLYSVPLIIITAILGNKVVEQVMEDDYEDKYSGIHKPMDWLWSHYRDSLLSVKVGEGGMMFLAMICLLTLFVTCGMIFGEGHSLVGTVILFSTEGAPLLSWVGVVALLYFSALFVGKKVYAITKALSKLQAKADES